MDLLGMGGGEVLLILVVAVLILGPGKVVEFGRSLGKMAHTLKKATSDLTSQVTRELEDQEKTHSPKSRKDL